MQAVPADQNCERDECDNWSDNVDRIFGGITYQQVLRATQHSTQRLEEHHRDERAFDACQEWQGHQPHQRRENPHAQTLCASSNGPDCEQTRSLQRRHPEDGELPWSRQCLLDGGAQSFITQCCAR